MQRVQLLHLRLSQTGTRLKEEETAMYRVLLLQFLFAEEEDPELISTCPYKISQVSYGPCC